MDTCGLITVHVRIGWILTNIWWGFHVIYTFNSKVGDVFNTYFTLCKYHQFALGANPHVFMLSVFFTLCSSWNHDTVFMFILLSSLFQDLIRDQGLPRSDGGKHPRRKLDTQLFPHHLTSLCSWIFFICVRVCVCVQSCALPVTEPWAEGQGFSRMSGLSAPPGSAPPHVKLKHLKNFLKVPTKQLCSKASQYMESVKQCFQCNLGLQ